MGCIAFILVHTIIVWKSVTTRSKTPATWPSAVSGSSVFARPMPEKENTMVSRLPVINNAGEVGDLSQVDPALFNAAARDARHLAGQVARSAQGRSDQRAHYYPSVTRGGAIISRHWRWLANACGCCTQGLAQNAFASIKTGVRFQLTAPSASSPYGESASSYYF